MEITIPETRGAPAKYDFNMEVGEIRSYDNTKAVYLINSAKSYCKRRGLAWKFRCYTMDGLSHIVRVK